MPVAAAVTIRIASIEDVPHVSALWKKMVHELAPDYDPNVEWWVTMCERLIGSGIYHLVVADTGKEIVGFIDGIVFPEPSTGKVHGIGQHLYVLPEYRKTFTAGRLYRRLYNLCKEGGMSVAEFFCFEKDRVSWEGKGYVPVRLLMRREIKCLIQ